MRLGRRFGGALPHLLLATARPSSSLNFDLAVDLGMFDSVERVGSGDQFLAFSPDKEGSGR